MAHPLKDTTSGQPDKQFTSVHDNVVSISIDQENTLPPFDTQDPVQKNKGGRFWIILSTLLLSVFLAVIEAYAVSTALPIIVSDLHANQFIWVTSAYGIASTALLPLSGGLAQVFGCRPVILSSVALFALGGALCGAAQNMNMLIAARVVQGAGAGGIYSLSQIILSNLVPLQDRGTYNGLFGLAWAIGGCVGPIVGGSLARHTTWRWIFYLNVPASGVIAATMVAFLKLSEQSSKVTLFQALEHLDGIGNTLIIGATCSIVIGLTWGGVVFPWVSAQVLAPICVGLAGLLVFSVHEWRYEYPAVPPYLLSNRTSLSGYIQIALSAFINLTLLYYLPVYYQACKEASPTASGVDILAICVSTGPPTILTGVSIAKTKRYRPQLWIAWSLILVGLGLTSSITESTSRAASIAFQVPSGIGIGMIYSAAYFPVLAPLSPSSHARALSFFVFLRTFAQIWGVTIGGALLQNGLHRRLPRSVSDSLPGLSNIAYAIIPQISSMEQPTKAIVQRAFADSLGTVWQLLIGIAGAGLLSSLAMRGLPLHMAKDDGVEA